MKRTLTLCIGLALAFPLVPSVHAQLTLRNFDETAETFIWRVDELPPDSGFVHGTNYFEDIAKGTVLTLPDGMDAGVVQTVRVFFGFKSDAIANETYDLEIYDGDAQSGPTDLIGSQTFNLSDIQSDSEFTLGPPTVHTLDTPLKGPLVVGKTFFVVLNFGTYGQPGWAFAAIGASGLQGQRIVEDWEQWSDGTWHAISDAWTGSGADGGGVDGFYMAIEADVEAPATANEAGELPDGLALEANYPNPFQTETTLAFTLAAPGPVVLTVHDVLGKEVARLVDESRPAGRHQEVFTPGTLPSGTYFYTLRAGSRHLTRTLFLTR